MKLNDFMGKGKVKIISKDIALAKSLVSTAKNDLKFLKSLKINSNSARKIMANYYDILRSILEAISVFDGYKIYAHEAYTCYLKEKNENLIAEKFDRFRKIRNGINYYGKNISVEEVKENSFEIIKLINELKKKYLDF